MTRPDSTPISPARRLGEPLLYAIYAGGLTIYVACLFYAALRTQTTLTGDLPLARPGEWSAPLDDVFIHFDFARATARGYPFQWSEGNGYSSGGTSLLYPWVLAPGYWIGFRGLSLMVWAALVAMVSTFAMLLGARRLFRDLPRFTSYFVPPAILGVGVLSWSLFSGMEVALFLALWIGAFIAWDDLLRGAPGRAPTHPGPKSWLLGLWGALLVATRPEAAVLVFLLGTSAAYASWRERGARRGLLTLIATGLPGVCVLIAQTLANVALTGESTAAGALVKLELHHPHMSRAQVWDAWWFHVRYQVMRVGNYHLSSVPGLGFLPVLLALVSLFSRRTRSVGALLIASAIAWVFIVALNGQVRWQNDRYTMPALAWLLLAATLGLSVLLTHRPLLGGRGRVLRFGTILLTVGAAASFAWFQRPKFRDQVWFFARASRNIRDQHVRTGRLLSALEPRPTRVLVGDAGAIPYMSDLPALDIIGLGGYRGLPFARATRQGVGAAIELLERMPPDQRPDLFAIYPGWWGTFPLWFGDVIAEVPVTGNVICAGPAKVLYRPRWASLEGSGTPFRLLPGERVVATVDVADLVSENEQGYSLDAIGFIDMKLLPDPRQPSRDVWDAGRVTPEGKSHRFRLSGFVAGRSGRLLLRVAPTQRAELEVHGVGDTPSTFELAPSEGWVELAVPMAPNADTLEVVVRASRGEHTLFHAFAVQGD